MAGIAVTPDRAANLPLSASYLDETLALVVPDHRREAFQLGGIRSMGPVRIGVPAGTVPRDQAAGPLPQARSVRFNGLDDIFSARRVDAERSGPTAERGSIGHCAS